MSEDLQRMYQDAIKAMKAGDQVKARDLLNEVIENDEENMDAWVALSKVVDNDDEKRICLTTILQLDPTNAYARKALEKSEAKIEKTSSDEEVAPGITRGLVRKVAIGSAVYVLVVFLITMLIVLSINGGKNAERAELTKIASNLNSTSEAIEAGNTAIAATQMMEAITATARAQLLVTPSATPTQVLAPTWTLTPEQETVKYRVLDKPPADVSGMISGWGGRDATNSGYVDLFHMPANGSQPPSEIINELGRNLASDVPGQTIAFERYDRQEGSSLIVTLNPSQPNDSMIGFSPLFIEARITDMRNPSLSADGSMFVFDAIVIGTDTREIFLININAYTITRITNDIANYTTPELSQNGTQILAVRKDPSNGTDLVLIDVATLNQVQMTTDGDALIESQPSWHRDNIQAVYKAHPPGQENNNEIYILRILADSGSSILLIATDADESYPIMDPNGRYVAFASNRGAGVYNIYIFDINTLTTYQLTEDGFNTFPGGWSLS
jgi:hypothetical protein